MKIFALTHDTNLAHIRVFYHEDRAVVEQAIAAEPDGRSGDIIEGPDSMPRMSGPTLVKLYNGLRPEDAPIGSFHDLATGRRRLFSRIEETAVKLEDAPPAPAIEIGEPTVTEEYPDMATKTKKSKAAAAKAPRTRKPDGAGKPVREGSSLAKIVSFMIDGNKTAEQMAKVLDLRKDQVLHRIGQVLRVNNGIGHKVSDDGKISIVYPKGFGPATIIKARATA